MKSSNISAIVGGLFLIGIIVFSIYIEKHEDSLLEKNGRIDTATITGINVRKGGSVKIKYDINGKVYTASEGYRVKGVEIGEMYKIVYYPPDPEKVNILWEEPIFPSGERGQVLGKITNTWNSKNIVEFEFELKVKNNETGNIGTMSFSRRQFIPNNKFKEGDEVLGEFLVNNVEIAYIVK